MRVIRAAYSSRPVVLAVHSMPVEGSQGLQQHPVLVLPTLVSSDCRPNTQTH